MTRLFVACLLLPGLSVHGESTPANDGLENLTRLAGQALMHPRARAYLEELADGIGPRVTGSPQEIKALDWAEDAMHKIGLSNVHRERWHLQRSWERASAHATLVKPFHLELTIASMGWAGSTPKGGIEAAVVEVDSDSMSNEVQTKASGWSGKVLLLVGQGTQHLGAVEYLAKLPAFLQAAHAARAAAVIIEDPRPGTLLPHTGPASFSDAVYPIPAVDMAKEHRKLIARLLNKAKPVQIKIDIQNQISAGPVESANLIGDIPGREHPEEIIVLAAHLDSWDLGTGAIDDGFGVAAVLGAANAIVSSGLKPRRTIRIALFTGEEQGMLGSRTYVRGHHSEMRNHVCALALDWGHGPITGMPLAGHSELAMPLKHFAEMVVGLGPLKIENGYLTFTDAYSFTLAGVPGIAFLQNSHDSYLLGHSAADTLDKVDIDVLIRDAALAAQAAFWIADQPTRLGTVFDAKETARILTQDKQRPNLEALGLWPF